MLEEGGRTMAVAMEKGASMDLQKLMQEKGPQLVEQLTSKAGFAPQQAQSFLQRLVAKVVDLVKGGGLDLKALVGGGDFGSVLSKLGLGQIASQVGIDEAKATAGAKAVLPGILQFAQQQLGGLHGVAGAAGDILKKAGGLFGKG
jgi:hypothetical protein